MLGSLHGNVSGRLPGRILVEVQEIGYWVFTGGWQPEGTILCYLHHHIREESSDLYGFATLDALMLFEQLLTVSGVGPKAALTLLSLDSVERIQQAIIQKDLTFITRAPGIGTRVGQKILVELEGKVQMSNTPPPSGNYELEQALLGLGYKIQEISPVLTQLPAELTSLNDQLKWALQQLS